MQEKSFKEVIYKEFKEDIRQNRLALLTGAGMKIIIFFLMAVALVLVVFFLALQLLMFLLPLLLIVVIVWFIFRYFNGLKTRKK